MDVATLDIKVSLKDGQVVAQQLDKITASSKQAEAAAAKLTSTVTSQSSAGRISSSEMADRVKRYDEMIAKMNQTTESYYESRAGIVQHSRALELDAKMAQQAAGAQGLHGLQVGRVNQEIGTFIGRITDSNTALSRLVAQIGGAAAGYGPMIAAMGAVAGLIWIYDKMTEGAKKATEEQKKLTDELVKWYETQRGGETGKRIEQIEATSKSLADQQKQLDALNKSLEALKNNYNAKTGLRDEGSIATTTEQISKLTAKMSEERNAITAGNADIVKSNNELLDSMQLQIARQTALNAVVGDGAVAIGLVANKYDGLAERQRLENTVGKEQLETFTDLVDRLTLLKDVNLVTAETMKVIADATKQATEEMNKYGAALAKIPTLAQLGAQKITTVLPGGIQGPSRPVLNAAGGGVNEIGAELQKAADDHARAIERTVHDTTRLAESFGILDKSTAHLIDGLGTMFASVGPLQTALANYSAGAGSLSTVLSTGAPLIGTGVALVVSSFTEAAKRAHELADSFSKLLQTSSDFAHPENDNNPYAAIHKQAQDIRDQANKLFTEMSKNAKNAAEAARAWTQAMNDANEGERARIALLEQERVATNAANNARIDQMVRDSAASNAAGDLQQNVAAWSVIEQQTQFGLSQLRASFAANAQATQDALDIARQQLSATQDIVDNTQKAVDVLRKYSDSLKLGDLSPLSPEQQYQEAKRQYDVVAAQAAAGDVNAAQQLPQFATAFLQQSKAMFASSSRFADDYNQVQTFLAVLQEQYGAQLSIEQKQLNAMQAAVSLLEQLVDRANGRGAAFNSLDDGRFSSHWDASLAPWQQSPGAAPPGWDPALGPWVPPAPPPGWTPPGSGIGTQPASPTPPSQSPFASTLAANRANAAGFQAVVAAQQEQTQAIKDQIVETRIARGLVDSSTFTTRRI
jgi:hypothetical protein